MPGSMRSRPTDSGADVHVALVGIGRHGRALLAHCLGTPGVRVSALCDIWPSRLQSAWAWAKARGHQAAVYADYEQMLAQERDLQAVVIATPDGFHADQTVACLKAGLHIYCEAEMHNTIEGCRRMVLAARQAGKLLQIGRQRRSNPHYHLALEHITGLGSIGRVTHVSGQRLGHVPVEPILPGEEVPASVLARHGYGTLERLVNWRRYADFSGGVLATLGNHQVDVFHWFLGGPPRAIIAGGDVPDPAAPSGRSAWRPQDAMCIFEWSYTAGNVTTTVRGDYHVLTSAGQATSNEVIIGDQGVILISENPTFGGIGREKDSDPASWEPADVADKLRKQREKKAGVDLEMKPPSKDTGQNPMRRYGWQPPTVPPRPLHLYHLANFFDAIRGRARLTCPAEVAFPTAVTVLRAAEAIRSQRRLELAPDEFVV